MIEKLNSVNYWQMPLNEALTSLKTSSNGLTNQEAKKRLAVIGKNTFQKKSRYASIIIFFKQFNNPLIILLMIATLFAFIFAEKLEGAIIFMILLINSCIGFFQEYRASKALALLSSLITSQVKVLRDGVFQEIDTAFLVPGDIVEFSIGDVIAADCMLLECKSFVVDEASLTGESLPVEKSLEHAATVQNNPAAIKNIVFAGTHVYGGFAKGVVIATGFSTYMGQFSKDIEKTVPSSFSQNIYSLGIFLMKITVALSLFVFLVNYFFGNDLLESALFALAICVGITPELLPLVITINLAKSALVMAKHSVIVKRLLSIENLGNMDILCTDKTGTLTEGILTLDSYITFDGQHDEKILMFSLLCREDIVDGKSKNPIDKAIIDYVAIHQVPDICCYKVIDMNTFDFVRRRLSVLVHDDKTSSAILITKGSLDSILQACSSFYTAAGIVPLTPEKKQQCIEASDDYENKGFRLIAVAYKETKNSAIEVEDEDNLIFLGMLLLIDIPKKDVKQIIQEIGRLGVTIKIMSGDSPLVTKRICHEVGLPLIDDRVVTGQELSELDEHQFNEAVHMYTAFARVHPEQKKQIIQLLQGQHHIVGYVGDGINDVPALQAADVGISVHEGVAIAKEAADIILLRKSLHVLSEGIILGRKSFANITKYILNTISSNFGNMITIALSSLYVKFIVLLPVQILLNNLLNDITLISLSTDNVDKDFIVKPRTWNKSFIASFMIFYGSLSSVIDIGFIVLTYYALAFPMNIFRTGLFLESFFCQIVGIFLIRTKRAFYKSKPSIELIGAAGFVLCLTVWLTVSHVGNNLFSFERLDWIGYSIVIIAIVMYLMIVEFSKRYFFKNF